ncbi:MAG: tripartite tricarboxylate transporter TctB family protein [Alphaproteobacteria bacterium]|nr:tripartite tricarboxylate transporter TctB family protein [Alphaproteobacteria bacterium]
MLRIRNMNDLVVGGLLIAVALLALALAARLAGGSATSMGPGYVPRLICFLQIAIGIAIVLRGLAVDGARSVAWSFRPLLWILVSVAFFALTIERLGLVLSIFGLVMLSTLGHPRPRLVSAILLGLFMAAFSVAVFVLALGLPMLVWPAALMR